MKRLLILALLVTGIISEAQETATKIPFGKPALIEVEALKEFESLPDDRKKLIRKAVEVAKNSPWLPYQFGGSSPKDGGFDCSGAMYFVMSEIALKPPRTSADQFLWVKTADRLQIFTGPVTSLDDASMKALRPGDLLFWDSTYAPTDGRSVNVTHVALFLGHEKSDGNAVMINATDGRSYRGTKANGYGVYDFRLPREGGKAVFMGYGTPPGIAEMKAGS
jgi:cell wall-associated NlpC family hydrolase